MDRRGLSEEPPRKQGGFRAIAIGILAIGAFATLFLMARYRSLDPCAWIVYDSGRHAASVADSNLIAGTLAETLGAAYMHQFARRMTTRQCLDTWFKINTDREYRRPNPPR